MNLAQLKDLIREGEGQYLELKSSTASLVSGMQTVCAFLNGKGGHLIFGVQDDGRVTGQIVSDKTLKEIATELNKVEPHAQIDIEYLLVDDNRQVIVFIVKADNKAPYSYDGRSFVRNQSTTIKMPREEHIYLYNKNNQQLWESLTNNYCTIDDLDHAKIKEIVRTAVFEKRLPLSALQDTVEEVLIKLNLIAHDKITNAAVVLFCKDEQKLFFQCRLQLARFKGTDKKEFLDIKMFHANAFDLYDKAMDYLHFCLPVAARIEEGNPIRVETPTIPYKVLREAVTNALIHRDYSNPGGSIAIAVYDDRVNIMNIGALPPGIEIDQLTKNHASIQRNPLIANVFYLCGKIEGWGRGTLDMIEDSRAASNPVPKYEEVGGTFSITLPFQQSIRGELMLKSELVTVFHQKLTKRQQQIVDVLKLEPMTRQELMAKMETEITDRAMQLQLASLKSMGVIDSQGKSTAVVWFLK